jgi:hypothetical protein
VKTLPLGSNLRVSDAILASRAPEVPVLAPPQRAAVPSIEAAGRGSAIEAARNAEASAGAPPRGIDLNKVVVAAYKAMGFAILGTILLGLASFLATNLFYLVSSRWVTPLELSSTDPRVLELDAQYAAAKAARDGVATQRLELGARLADAERVAASEKDFQAEFEEAMQADLADRAGELASFRQLKTDLEKTRGEVTAANEAYTDVSKDSLRQEYAAHLIDKEQQARGGHELAEIAGANVALHEKNVEVDARILELKRQVASLRAAGARSARGAMSYEILHMRHEYQQSVLASRKAEGERDALSKSVGMLDQTLASYDAQLARIAKAPILQAADKSVHTAFVPYDDLAAVRAGEKVYACAAGFAFCRAVGAVSDLLEGEVTGKHPLYNRELRGVLARLTLDDTRAIEKPVLFVGRKPLGI